MSKKLIMRSDSLPQHLQTELATMQSTLDQRYGVAAHLVGTTLENLTSVCAMVRTGNTMTDDERAAAYERSREVCADVMRTLSALLNVEQPAALAVARAYRDFSSRVEEELLGSEVLDDTKGAANDAIAKARMH